MATYINDNNEYYNGRSIVYDGQLIINPTVEQLISAGYHEVIPPEPTEEELLADAKEGRLMEIDVYDKSSNVNVFYLAGQPLWLDVATRQQLRTSVESYKAQGITNVTKWFGGQQYTFSTDLWISMLNALEVYAAEALNVTESHKAAINAMTDIEEINGYDITEGYPEVLNLTPQWLQSHL